MVHNCLLLIIFIKKVGGGVPCAVGWGLTGGGVPCAVGWGDNVGRIPCSLRAAWVIPFFHQ